jgi:flagellar basal-body rod protein FlgB
MAGVGGWTCRRSAIVSGPNNIIASRTISALEQMAAFTEARQKVIAENVANVDTPGYQHKKVDLAGFQQALAEAMRNGAADGLPRASNDQVRYDEFGRMVLRPAIEPADNLTFHDGTNGQIEKDMTDMADNQMLHQVATSLIQHHYRMLETAIRGRTV